MERSIRAHASEIRSTQSLTGAADFVLLSLAADTNWPIGPSIYVTNVIANQGLGTGTSFWTGIYLSTDPVITTSDVRVASLFGAVPAGASTTNIFNARVPSTVVPGWYFLGGIADFFELAPELSETNNSLAGSLIKVFLAVDLAVTHVGVPTSAGAGGFLYVTNVVQNIGASTHSDFTVGVYLSPDPTISLADTRLASAAFNGGLQGGASVTNRTFVALTNVPPGSYYLGVIADLGDAVAEINETNNAPQGSSIDVQVGVDQVMVSVSAPTTLTNCLRASITNVVANRGFAHSGPMFISHYLSSDNIINTNDVRFGGVSILSLVAGATMTTVADLFPPGDLEAGTYFLGAIVDHQNHVVETDESNNTALGPALELAYGPDLAYILLGFPSNVVGGFISITSVVQNIGIAPTAGFPDIELYLSEDSTITREDKFLAREVFFGLPMTYPLTNRTSVTLDSRLAPGVYYLGAILDPRQRVAEPNEANNSLVVPFHLTVEADLGVTRLSAHTNASVGGSLHVSLDVQNLASQAASAFTGIYLSRDAEIATNDFLVGSVARYLSGGEMWNHAVTLTLSNSIVPGMYYLGAIADWPGFIFELVETNNMFLGPLIEVRSELDLAPAAVTGPAIAVIGASYRMTNGLANLGLDSSAPTILDVYLSADKDIDSNDWLLGRHLCGVAFSGYSWQGITNFFVPTNVALGFYYLGGIADPTGLVPETDESNNTIVGGIVEVRDSSLIELTQLTLSGTNVFIRFTTVPGRQYSIECAGTLPAEWVPLAGAVGLAGTGNEVEVRHADSLTAAQRFYRVRLLP